VILDSFLNDLARILHPDYQPSDSDIVRARLRTTGVQEYHFTLDRGNHLPGWPPFQTGLTEVFQETIMARQTGSSTTLQVNIEYLSSSL
jgi:hypothetical protein